MSWTDIFPVLDDDMLDAYRAGVTDGEREEFEEWFGVESAVGGVEEDHAAGCGTGHAGGVRPPHIVSATLFWKHVNGKDPDLPRPTREMVVDAKRMGLVKRFAPWDSYVAPLLLHTRAAVERHPADARSLLLPIDVEYATWANPRSECVYF